MARPDHVARLYAVPLAEFTAARNRAVGELRKSGRDADARALARLRKPSPALWAVNRLASTERKSIAELFDAVARLRRAQLRDPRAAADAVRAQRTTLEFLVARARDVLTRAGLTASQQVVRRVSDTLMGAAIDRQHADALRRGELTEELAAPGFEAFSGTRIPVSSPLRLVPPPRPRPVDRAAAATPPIEADTNRSVVQAETLEREAADHARNVTQLEAESAKVLARLRAARRAARQATAAAKRARRELSDRS